MLVNEKGDIYGTVGGGTVEYTVIQEAENFLRENTGEDLSRSGSTTSLTRAPPPLA